MRLFASVELHTWYEHKFMHLKASFRFHLNKQPVRMHKCHLEKYQKIIQIMDWVHCNNCFLLPDSEKSFFLTSCGHIYCRDCEEQCARNQCKLCKNQCTTIILSSSMKPDVQIYFTDPDELLKKKIKEVQQVSEFQKNHRARLVAHQRKQLKKFKTVKDDFRKLIKSLKELDSERKRLAQENDFMKKFIEMQRNSSVNQGTAERSGRTHISPYDSLHSSSSKTVEAKLSDRSEKSKSHHSMPQRMCVISPPTNGKMGVIPNTPSPSSCLRKLNISCHSNEYGKRSPIITPASTPGSVCERFASFKSPQSSGSTLDVFSSPNDVPLKNQYKRDVRKLVVHPYSPDD